MLVLALWSSGCAPDATNDDGGDTADASSLDAGSVARDAGDRLDAGVDASIAPTDGSTDAPAPIDAATARCTGRTGVAGEFDVEIVSGGLTRTFWVHVPESYDPTTPTMVVLSYHGWNNTGRTMNGMSGMNAAADARGFISVHPYGTRTESAPELSWNAGRCCGTAPGRHIDDVQFTRDMLDRLERDYCVDTRRVFATGWSNGAMLTHRLACDLADRIAAIAPVSGAIAIDPDTCVPSRPIAVLTSHGTADDRVPWEGGGPGNAESVPDTVAHWAARNGCTDATPTEIYRMDPTHCDTRRECDEGTESRLCAVEGGTHNWLNRAAYNYDTTTTILDFFDAHPMP